jgi:hypothetical protein
MLTEKSLLVFSDYTNREEELNPNGQPLKITGYQSYKRGGKEGNRMTALCLFFPRCRLRRAVKEKKLKPATFWSFELFVFIMHSHRIVNDAGNWMFMQSPATRSHI